MDGLVHKCEDLLNSELSVHHIFYGDWWCGLKMQSYVVKIYGYQLLQWDLNLLFQFCGSLWAIDAVEW